MCSSNFPNEKRYFVESIHKNALESANQVMILNASRHVCFLLFIAEVHLVMCFAFALLVLE